jgi:hypothetical protein
VHRYRLERQLEPAGLDPADVEDLVKGVRSSWLMRDRNSLLAWFARSASAVAALSSRVRAATRCSSSAACPFTRSSSRACVIATASCAAASWAIPSCSGGNGSAAAPRLIEPMSSPPAIIGTTM